MDKINQSYYQLFSSPLGREVLEDMKDRASLTKAMIPDFSNSNKLFFIEGRRSIPLEIEGLIKYFEKETIEGE